MKYFFILLVFRFLLASCGTSRNVQLATETPPRTEKAATDKIIRLLKATLCERAGAVYGSLRSIAGRSFPV